MEDREMPTEKELDRELEAGLRKDTGFLKWFIGRTKFKGDNPRIERLRSDNPWSNVQFTTRDESSGELRSAVRGMETDILLVFSFSSEPDRHFAIHIENKLATGTFTEYQTELYEVRARQWSTDPRFGLYEDWDTVLIAPLIFYERNVTKARRFGSFISHEDLGQYLPLFQQPDAGKRYQRAISGE